MPIDLLQIDKRLRERICPSCVRFTGAGTCSLPKNRPCSLFENLAEVVDVVRHTHSRRIDPYVDALRSRVCAACHFEDEHGSCPCRNNVDCGLDTYFPLIVEVIEDELAR
ncbi:MAG: hypothetical protein MI923_28025 [Phycisphaerales bacterium]|nr:hypothetical protein [Phycisphaerales bacterium]